MNYLGLVLEVAAYAISVAFIGVILALIYLNWKGER